MSNKPNWLVPEDNRTIPEHFDDSVYVMKKKTAELQLLKKNMVVIRLP